MDIDNTMPVIGPCGCKTTKDINYYLKGSNTSACNNCNNFKQVEPGIYGCASINYQRGPFAGDENH